MCKVKTFNVANNISDWRIVEINNPRLHIFNVYLLIPHYLQESKVYPLANRIYHSLPSHMSYENKTAQIQMHVQKLIDKKYL